MCSSLRVISGITSEVGNQTPENLGQMSRKPVSISCKYLDKRKHPRWRVSWENQKPFFWLRLSLFQSYLPQSNALPLGYATSTQSYFLKFHCMLRQELEGAKGREKVSECLREEKVREGKPWWLKAEQICSSPATLQPSSVNLLWWCLFPMLLRA